jgi:large subunit ribosomal protein L21
MFAIVDIKGVQFKVQENQKLFIPKINEESGKKVEFDKVLVFSPDDTSFEIGSPVLNHKVEATILNQIKDDKVTVFKKKKRKGYKVKKGHRQQYTEISIDKIS